METNDRPSERERPAQTSGRVQTKALYILTFVALFWLLRETSSISMPIAFALLLAFAVWPLVNTVRAVMPKHFRWVGAAVAMIVVLAVLAIFLLSLGMAMQQVYDLTQAFGPNLQDRLLSIDLFGILSSEGGLKLGALAPDFTLASTALSALNITTSMIAGILLVLFMLLLMLTEADNWQQKIAAISKADTDRRWLTIGNSVGQKFRAYFATRFIVGGATALLYVAWLAAFGVDYLLLWGLLAVLLNFIPTVGSIVAGLLPVTYALITRDIGSAVIIATGIVIIEQIMGNLVDPKLMGRQLAISPLVALASLVFWSLLWGLPGALIAVPATVLLTMVMAHFDRFKPVALLLTNCSSMEDLEDYSTPD